MGLDVGYFRQLRLAVPEPQQRRHDQHVMFTASELEQTESGWPGFTGGIQPGVYTFAAFGDFSAGSYVGYDEWRQGLARFAFGKSLERAWMENPKGAFAELLRFADDSGVIGAAVSAKLARDFAENEDRAVEYAKTQGQDDWLALYRDFKRAFETAADGGAVYFY